MIATTLRGALLAGLAGSFLTSAAAAEKWDMALAYAATNYHSEIAAEFAQEVGRETGGKLEIVTHPSGSLFGGAEIYGAVRKGLVPIGERLISALGNEDPLFEIDSVPFLASGFDEAWRLYEVTKPALEETLAANRLHLLYSCPWPPQGFYSVVEANSLDDIKGMKFRAYNATTSRLAELLGMVPTKIEAAELSQAFATGVAQSMISSGSTGYDRKLWEHVKYFYDVQAWLPRNMVIVNLKAWRGLDDDTRAAVEVAAANAEAKCWDKAKELTNWYVEQLAANGMIIGTLNEEMTAEFKKAGAVLMEAWVERAGDSGKGLIEAYKQAQ